MIPNKVYQKVIHVLLVEDDDMDIEITIKAFESTQFRTRIFSVKDGDEALDYLNKRGKYKDKSYQQPDLILLDINMPRVNGFTVLKQVKQSSQLKVIPVIMLTSSRNQDDVKKSYELGASGYIPKPVNYDDFKLIVDAFNEYWHEINILPSFFLEL